MGWFEFLGWVKCMDRQKKGPEPDPESWKNAQAEEHWAEWKENRERRRGRLH